MLGLGEVCAYQSDTASVSTAEMDMDTTQLAGY